jgi:predicted NACHT family NTPase
MIVDRIKREKDLRAINYVRGVLLGFYRSDYPIETSREERLAKLQKNGKVKVLLDALNEYLVYGNMSASKRFLIKTLIGNLNGTHFL